jgi:hypothetical protein
MSPEFQWNASKSNSVGRVDDWLKEYQSVLCLPISTLSFEKPNDKPKTQHFVGDS